mgnify:CR=1 FL=1
MTEMIRPRVKYVIGPDGKLVQVIDLGASSDTIVAAIRKWL